MTTKKLTAKQEMFVSEYLKDLNATQAAIRAGYSKKTAEVQAYQLLQKTLVKKAIMEGKKERSEKTGIDVNWVLTQAVESFRINAKIIYDDQGNEKQTNPRAAKGFLELVGKHVDIQAFKEQLKVEGEVDMVSPLLAARKRLEAAKK